MEYTGPDIETDAAAIKDLMVQRLQDGIPGLAVQDGHPLNFMLEGIAEVGSELFLQLAATLDEGFASIGKNLLRVPQTEATYATSTATVTRLDSTGAVTLPAGTQITLAGADGSRVGFTTTNEVTLDAGELSTAAGEVGIIATDPGSAGTGLQADAQLEDALAWVDTITVVAATTGGEDAEDDDSYRSRLADVGQLLGRTLVIPLDYEIDARNNIAGVSRALALDLYNPADSTSNNPGMIAVAVIDEDGLDPGSLVRDAGEAAQQALSVSQMTVNWIAATYTTITVVFAAKCYPEFDPADVEARAEAAVLAFLSPSRWGLPPFGDRRDWINTPVVRYRDIVAVIENVEGLDYTLAPTGTATTTNGSPNLTLVTPTTGWVNGMVVTGTGIPAGTRILSGAGTATMVMSANATASAAGVAITGAAVTVNNGTADVTMTGAAPLPATNSTAAGTVTLP